MVAVSSTIASFSALAVTLTLPRGNDGNDRECGAFRLPAFAAAAGVVVQGLSVDFDFDLMGRAQALQGATGEAWRFRRDAVIQRRVQFYWAHFLSPTLRGEYEKLPGGARPGQPVST